MNNMPKELTWYFGLLFVLAIGIGLLYLGINKILSPAGILIITGIIAVILVLIYLRMLRQDK
jgi:hypothetical protein